MRNKIIIFILVLILGALLNLYIRSIGLSESATWSSKEIDSALITITNDFEIGWGPHGLRFWIYTDHQKIHDFEEDIITPKARESEFIFDGDSGWNWPVKSFWNKHGFWLNYQKYRWDDLHYRWMTLVAVPFWLPLSIVILFLILSLKSLKNKTTEPNQSPETTTMAVTPAASHPSRQP